LVLGWSGDAGDLGRKATDYLNSKLKGQKFAEIEREGFFLMGGVAVKDNVARFPESEFYVCPDRELVVFQTDSPATEWYEFLSSVLNVAEGHCRVREIYVLGAMISFSAHTTPRQLLGIANSVEAKETLSQYDLNTDVDYQTQPGQRPTLNSYLSWLARDRNIRAVSLWVPIPFYLAPTEDAQARKRVLSFLNERLRLGIDFCDLDQEIRRQNEQLARARSRFPQVDDYINRLESNLMLSEEQNGELIEKIEGFLWEGG
jgi:proteasome assembly chaperone (PAC2) family protein